MGKGLRPLARRAKKFGEAVKKICQYRERPWGPRKEGSTCERKTAAVVELAEFSRVSYSVGGARNNSTSGGGTGRRHQRFAGELGDSRPTNFRSVPYRSPVLLDRPMAPGIPSLAGAATVPTFIAEPQRIGLRPRCAAAAAQVARDEKPGGAPDG